MKFQKVMSFVLKMQEAYCFSMASNYNSRYRPAEVLWYEGKSVLIRERESFDDLIRNQIDVKDLFEAKNQKASIK